MIKQWEERERERERECDKLMGMAQERREKV